MKDKSKYKSLKLALYFVVLCAPPKDNKNRMKTFIIESWANSKQI